MFTLESYLLILEIASATAFTPLMFDRMNPQRTVYETLRIPKERFRKLAVYGEPGRIAAYRDGSIWRMVIVVFALELETQPDMTISAESKDLRFFSREEIKNIEIVITHSDIVEDWFLNK